MAKEFDATLSRILGASPADWAAYFAAAAGLPPGPAEPLDTDLSATAQADALFRVGGPVESALHAEFESSSRLGRPQRLLEYNVPARKATRLPVRSVLVLLRPEANSSDLTGELVLEGADGMVDLVFRYKVVRVWKLPLEGLLAAGPAVAALALLTDEAAADPGAAVGRLRERLRRPDVPVTLAEDVRSAAYFLCGLRYEGGRIATMFGNWDEIMQDSSTYQEVIRKGEAKGRAEGRAEGRAAEAHGLLLRLGARRFGPPTPAAEAAVRAVADPDRLGRIADRLLDADGWDDLLATP